MGGGKDASSFLDGDFWGFIIMSLEISCMTWHWGRDVRYEEDWIEVGRARLCEMEPLRL
jgi:hypothetical protein